MKKAARLHGGEAAPCCRQAGREAGGMARLLCTRWTYLQARALLWIRVEAEK